MRNYLRRGVRFSAFFQWYVTAPQEPSLICSCSVLLPTCAFLQGSVTRGCNHGFVRVGKQIGRYGEHAGLLLVGRAHNRRLLGRHAAGGD